jgi:hypothetical protein
MRRMPAFSTARMAARYLRDLPAFLTETFGEEDCRRHVERRLETREESFLRIVSIGVFGNPRSPYRRLLAHLGIEQGDVVRLVGERGVEEALAELYEAGVRVSLEEVRGRRPLVRRGLELRVRESDFENPLNRPHFGSRSGGSSSGGVGRPVPVDLHRLEHNACYHRFLLAGFGLLGRPFGLWAPVPGVAANNALVHAKLGIPVDRWFTQSRLELRPASLKYAVFIRLTVAASRLGAVRIAMPEYAPPGAALRVARWLAETRDQGRPAVLRCTSSTAVRVCHAAREGGLDISGTAFRVSGEPYTSAKAEVVGQAGCHAACSYSMSELGLIGVACPEGTEVDDVHLVRDAVGVLQRDRTLATGEKVGALYYTTLHPGSAKLLLNAESGDCGVLEDRGCSCPAGEMGLTTHLHSIRSYDKLTTEGMNFLGSAMVDLVEEVLPGRFGGHPCDYQFVEQERNGMTTVAIAVSPGLGGIDEGEVVDAVLAYLASRDGGEATMSRVWRSSRTLRVTRRDPMVSPAGKVPPLLNLRDGAAASG